MSKSNLVEIVAILYIITGLLIHNWLRYLAFGLAIENTIESIVWAIKEYRTSHAH